MAYQALYRTWRPQRFEDVVGQEMITKTLRNAVMTNQTSHAYLFTGPRGTGKTSTAKIFAKAINCHHQENGEPCNECEICKAITNGSLNDVLEIDAASNNGVEEIRDIRDKVKYAPTQADYKVYIIDEVHMLSTGAFNALLKTLEEPPANVVFILATTEPHKIPATIISRTQRFDFKRITSATILKRMEYILNQKDIQYEDAALKVIAKAAEGGMRDALSILDQVISFGENNVTLENALLVTGSVTKTDLLNYLQAVVDQKTPEALEMIHKLVQDGKDASRIVEDLVEYCRDLLLYQQSPAMLEETELGMLDEAFKKFAQEIEPEIVYQMINILNEQQENMRYTSHPTVYLEVLTVKLSQLKNQPQVSQANSQPAISADQAQIDRLMNRIQQLQDQINSLQQTQPQAARPARRQVVSTNQTKVKEVKVNYEKINEVLGNATRADLNRFQQVWGDLVNMLTVPQRAIMSVSKPVAASSEGVVIGFEYPYLCQKAIDDRELQDALTNGLSRIVDQNLSLLFLPNEQWLKIRQDYLAKRKNGKANAQPAAQAENDAADSQSEEPAQPPIVAEAQKLFGKEAVQVKED
ncbi:DNA polymerase III subunit gamma/tau [Ligilactobacillus aviarius]|uniref:DNA-directed DNA polymerase n=1 Tax=Ligilactobacillus aviarius TaxID=1606 RepID=A0A510WT41_9LACO|nr:DNA polymerase III subunit gamma/tau [Ligilactobacillus aviarius]KRM39757.1 DNA polymerase III subunits gamma and tau [Ligilactobacillus aviarius subsp. aviarius DSM 20655]GEK41757.1 DNA polymerase III subunit gamma/tau [Ligilactobacillus aviarius]